MDKRNGFTLIELLVVIIIIVILAGTTVAMMNTFFRGQGVRQGTQQVIAAFARARQFAADQRVMHFVVLGNQAEGGFIEIHRDGNPEPATFFAPDRTYNGDNNPGTVETNDPQIEGKRIELPKYVEFRAGFPTWIGINPTGFSTGYVDMAAGQFENNEQNNVIAGDLVLQMQNQNYKMCIDIDKGAGKVRRWYFLNLP